MIALLATSPDAALLTLAAGILLVYFECNRPGTILPGCVGALLTLLAIDAFGHMPLRPLPLALCAVGIAFILAELFLPARNAIAAMGTALLVVGLRTAIPVQPFAPAPVHTSIAVAVSFALVAATLWLGRIALRARRNKRTISSLAHHLVACAASRRHSLTPHRNAVQGRLKRHAAQAKGVRSG